MSKWKPGDVALVLNEFGVWNTAIRVVGRPDYWQYGVSDATAHMGADARPLVVIDPEDAEQVERLMDIYFAIGRWNEDPTHDLRDALREFAGPTPAKPEEPQGLGAVVLCGHHNRYIHLGDGKWQHISKHRGIAEWDDLAVVRVLSEGVTS